MKNICIGLQDQEVWEEYFSRVSAGKAELFFSPQYYRAYEKKGDGTARCFIFEKNGEAVLYPFLMNPLERYGYKRGNESYYDIEGAYGYNGVLSTTTNASFARDFRESFLDFCCQSGVIAEFTRFNPVLKNEAFSGYMEVLPAGKNVIVDLNPSEEDIWLRSYDYAVRKSVNKAKRNHLEVKVCGAEEFEKEGWIDQFMEVFYSTLDRNRADTESYFDETFVRNLVGALGKQVLFFFTLLGKKAVSAEMVLLSHSGGYSFLGGTLKEAYSYRPNHLLKDHLIRTLKKTGRTFYCIGGGKNPEDGIFKYKKSFAPGGVCPFYIGRKIHNEGVYRDVCEKWEKSNPEKIERFSRMFMKYKM